MCQNHINEEKTTRKTFAEIIKECGLNDEQVQFLQQYSRERSRRAYEIIAAKELGSNELIDGWEYDGYYDSGYRGAEYCSAGHALRYVHIARHKETGKTIKFGVKCVSDFFNLTPIQIKFIKNGFNEANHEIQEILDTYIQWEGNFDAYEEKFHYAEKLKFITAHDPDKLYLASDSFMNMLKIAEMQALMKLRLPLPSYFEYALGRAFRAVSRTYEQSKDPEVKEKKNPHQEIFDYLKEKHPDAYKTANSIWNNSLVTTLSEKQSNLFNKLMTTKWKDIDTIVDMVANKKIPIRPNYFDIYESLSSQYQKWGMSEKQFTLLGKCLAIKA